MGEKKTLTMFDPRRSDVGEKKTLIVFGNSVIPNLLVTPKMFRFLMVQPGPFELQ